MKQLRALAYGAIVFALVLVSVLAIIWAAGAEYDDLEDQLYSVENESQVADVGNWTALDPPTKANRYLDNETITNPADQTLSEGTDYEFNTSAGTVLYYGSSKVTDGATMDVEYWYAGPSESSRHIFDVVSVPVRYVLPAGILLSAGMSAICVLI